MSFKWSRAALAAQIGMANRAWLLCSVGGVGYAVPAPRVRHLVVAGPPAADHLVFEDESYPILDARTLFGLPPAPAGGRLILIVDEHGRRGALLVDAVRTLARIDPDARQPLPAVYRGRERGWFEGVARVGDELVVLLSPSGVLDGAATPVEA